MRAVARSVIVGAVAVALLSACTGTQTESTTPPAGKTVATDPWVLSENGIGPFKLGARVEELEAAGLLDKGTSADDPECPELTTVTSAGKYAGNVLVIRHNVLVEIGTAGSDPAIHSPSGAAVGMSFDELRKIYGTRGSIRKDSKGKPGFVVPVGDRVLVFSGHPIRPGVGYFAAGYADYTLHTHLTGKGC